MFQEKTSSKSVIKCLQKDSETSNVVWLGDDITRRMTRGRDGGNRVKDVEILFGSGKNGQD